MSGDYSRQRFDPQRDFSGVLMQQGRVQLDADWNEQVEILDRRWRAETLDVVGRCGVPHSTPLGFQIGVDAKGQLTIGRGRIYVDGLLAENHGGGTLEFDALLAESRGSADTIDFGSQPYVPLPAPLPKPGKHLIYLDVSQREMTFLEAPDLVEKAVGVDTTARLQTVWQVKILPDPLDAATTCGTPDEKLPGWPQVIPSSAGRLSTAVVDIPKEQGPCLLPPTVGYRGLENRLYRVEIHQGGSPKKATFKWSRDNASVVSAVTAIPTLDTLIVDQTGRDSVLRFNEGDWIEITDDVQSLSALPNGMLPGEMRKIKQVDPMTRTITLDTSLTATVFATTADKIQSRHTRIRRWDQTGADVVANQGVLPVPGDATPVTLEDGIQVSFSTDPKTKKGEFHVGDYWVFAARTADATIEELNHAPPRGIHHHFGRLALAQFAGEKWSILSDCRDVFPPLTELTSLFNVSGDGQEVAPDPTQPAKLLPLPQTLQVGVSNGQWPVAGAQVRFAVKIGGGQVQGGGNQVIVTTGADGVASCAWSLDATTPDQQVEATLLDSDGQSLHLPVRFHANLSVASRVAYEPKACPTLAGVINVQDAIDKLCQATHGGCCCVTVGVGGEFKRLDEALQALAEKKVADVCICLLPGDHEMIGANVSDPIVHLSVTGCGPGTRLKIVERPWRMRGLASFALRDLAVTADGLGEPLQTHECQEVTIRGCHLSQTMRGGALVTISFANRVQLADNVIVALVPRIDPFRPLFSKRLPEVAKLFEMQDEKKFRKVAAVAAAQAAKLKPRERSGIAADLKKSVASLSGKISAAELAGFQGIVEALAAEEPQAELLAQRFDLLRVARLRAFPGLALVLTNSSDSAVLENNSITGTVSLYGPPGPTDLTPNDFKQLGAFLSKIPSVFSASQGTLNVRGNRLTRLTISEISVTQIRTFLNNPQAVTTFDRIYKLSFLTDNKLDDNGNHFFGDQLSFTANAFFHLGQAEQKLAGWAVSNTALFMGNQAPLVPGSATSLANVARSSFPKPKLNANFILQIDDFGG